MMEKFGEGFSEALKSTAFRTLIKNEALKRFNKDTDVLYQSIKDLPINGNMQYRTASTNSSASTLHSFLIPFFASEQELNDFENKMPLLTIYVPELPENYFSAETWDVNDPNQIPDVALRLDNITYIPVIGRDDDNYLIAPEDVPSWAIVVLKDNERVVDDSNAAYSTLDTRILSTNQSGDKVRFLDNNFDPIFQPFGVNDVFPTATNTFIPQHLKDAFNALNPSDNTSWHRDFTYYNLTQSNQESPLSGGKYREFVSTFRLVDLNAQSAYNNVADGFNDARRDPMLRDTWQRRANGVSAWTDGSFEFAIKTFQGRKNSNLGLTINNGFGAMPDELFVIEWDQRVTGKAWWRRYWLRPRITDTKTKNLLRQCELSTWDLFNASNEWKFTFEEVDAASTTTLEQNTETKFNANLEISGEYKKIGFKFGAKLETTKENKFKYVFNEGSDDLKDKDIHFRDNSIIQLNNSSTNFILRKYSTGRVEFSLVPLQVQN